jgi:hypothetical protein
MLFEDDVLFGFISRPTPHFQRLPLIPLPKGEILLQHLIEDEICMIFE